MTVQVIVEVVLLAATLILIGFLIRDEAQGNGVFKWHHKPD